jgi:hypothetical protein
MRNYGLTRGYTQFHQLHDIDDAASWHERHGQLERDMRSAVTFATAMICAAVIFCLGILYFS